MGEAYSNINPILLFGGISILSKWHFRMYDGGFTGGIHVQPSFPVDVYDLTFKLLRGLL
jgi:hypothetical protein